MRQSNDEQEVVRRRLRRWAAPLYENSSLRDDLTDAQAKQILDWGKEHLRQTAVATASFLDDDANPLLEREATAVQLIIRGVNNLMGSIGRSPDFDVIDDTMTRLLKNLRWLTNRKPTAEALEQVSRFNQAREQENRKVAFTALLTLVQLHTQTESQSGKEEK